MSASYKSRAKAALDNFLKKSQAETAPKISNFKNKKARNKRPEKDLVQMPCNIWLKQQGFSVETYESKATWDQYAQSWVQKGMKAGTPDLIGVSPLGFAVYIEYKAPGKRASVKMHQEAFLIEKIEHGAFAAVIDSLDLLQAMWAKWSALRAEGKIREARDYLLTCMPKKKTSGAFSLED